MGDLGLTQRGEGKAEPEGGSTLDKDHLGAVYIVCISKLAKKKGLSLIIATTLIEDMETVLLTITRERNRGSRKATSFTEASRCSLISKATLRLLQYPEMAVKS